MAIGEALMNTLHEYRNTREFCLETTHLMPEQYREAKERLTSAYPTRWPMTKGQFFGLSEEGQAQFSRYLGAEGPFWQVNEYLFWFDSHKRTFPMIKVMVLCDTAQRQLCIFLDNWDACDTTRPYRHYLAGMLRRARLEVDITELLEPEAQAWFNAAPKEIMVYRGCEAGHERGLSWTFDRPIAMGFACGKRWSNRNPTMVSAFIPKQHVFAVMLGRHEKEIVLDPRRLRRVHKDPIAQSPLWEQEKSE